MDGKLRLHQHVSETRNKIHARLRIMRSIRSQSPEDLLPPGNKDYTVPVLATIHPTQIEHLEKLQNEALQIMLGAPRWTKVCNIRAEAKIPQAKYQIHVMNTCLLGKKAAHQRYSSIIRNVHQSLAHNEELFRKKTWASKTAQGIKSIQAKGSFLSRTPDVPHPTYTHAPPWAESSLHFFITPLTDKKENLTTTDLARQAQRALAAGNTDGADVYFMDGSVDQKTKRTAAAFVHEEEIGHYRLPDHSSTLEQAKTRQKHEVRRLAAEGSPSANWYCAAINDAKDTLMTTPRLVMTRLPRLRLGYHCLAELNDTLPITRTHCNTPTHTPLIHYLEDCAATARFLLRDAAAPHIVQHTDIEQLIMLVKEYTP
ncbi:hypothetical protein O3P69_006428 [Scylla paramamosain]|uniref:Uncharacterized protein n=1 Tax=Scylla paramamosain TaxID=85552 RepID=A0AAW0U617_SCYPA